MLLVEKEAQWILTKMYSARDVGRGIPRRPTSPQAQQQQKDHLKGCDSRAAVEIITVILVSLFPFMPQLPRFVTKSGLILAFCQQMPASTEFLVINALKLNNSIPPCQTCTHLKGVLAA